MLYRFPKPTTSISVARDWTAVEEEQFVSVFRQMLLYAWASGSKELIELLTFTRQTPVPIVPMVSGKILIAGNRLAWIPLGKYCSVSQVVQLIGTTEIPYHLPAVEGAFRSLGGEWLPMNGFTNYESNAVVVNPRILFDWVYAPLVILHELAHIKFGKPEDSTQSQREKAAMLAERQLLEGAKQILTDEWCHQLERAEEGLKRREAIYS